MLYYITACMYQEQTCEAIVSSNKVNIAGQVGAFTAHGAHVLLNGAMRPALIKGHRKMQHSDW